MRRSIVLLLGASIAGSIAMAAPACITGTYTTYIALVGGCSIGDATFSNFSPIGLVGSPAITTDEIEVTPGGSTLDPTLTYMFINPTGAAQAITVNQNGQSFSVGFTYQLVLTGATLSSIQMDSTFANTAPGAASATKNAELLSGGTLFTSTVDSGGVSNPLTTKSGTQTAVTGTGIWLISDVDALQAQTTGSATSASFENLFGLAESSNPVTPEPPTLALLGIGLLALGWRRAVKA